MADIDKKLAELRAVLDRMDEAEDVRRCPACAFSRVKSMEGQERARVVSRMSRLRAEAAFDAGETRAGIAFEEVAIKNAQSEARFAKGWSRDELLNLRHAADLVDEKSERFRVLRGRPKKPVLNLTLAPNPD